MEEKKEMSTEEIKMDNDPKGEGKEKASSPLREVLSWVVTLLAAFALAMVLKNYVIINATVPTGQRQPDRLSLRFPKTVIWCLETTGMIPMMPDIGIIPMSAKIKLSEKLISYTTHSKDWAVYINKSLNN